MRKIFALSSILTLLLTAMPVFACIGDLCDPDMSDVGSVDTSFYNAGLYSLFHEGLWLEGEGLIEEIEAVGPAELTVVKNAEFGYDFDVGKTVNEDKAILWEPDSIMSSVSIAKDVWWGWQGIGGAEVYRSAHDSMVQDDVHAIAIGYDGGLSDRIEVNIGAMPLTVYQSVGLNQGATCEDPVAPPELTPPVCTWCD